MSPQFSIPLHSAVGVISASVIFGGKKKNCAAAVIYTKISISRVIDQFISNQQSFHQQGRNISNNFKSLTPRNRSIAVNKGAPARSICSAFNIVGKLQTLHNCAHVLMCKLPMLRLLGIYSVFTRFTDRAIDHTLHAWSTVPSYILDNVLCHIFLASPFLFLIHSLLLLPCLLLPFHSLVRVHPQFLLSNLFLLLLLLLFF